MYRLEGGVGEWRVPAYQRRYAPAARASVEPFGAKTGYTRVDCTIDCIWEVVLVRYSVYRYAVPY